MNLLPEGMVYGCESQYLETCSQCLNLSLHPVQSNDCDIKSTFRNAQNASLITEQLEYNQLCQKGLSLPLSGLNLKT